MAKFCAIAWTSCRSSLPAGPTAIRSVVGRSTMKAAPTAAAKNSSPAASTRNGEPFLRPRGAGLAEPDEPSSEDIVLPDNEKRRATASTPATAGLG